MSSIRRRLGYGAHFGRNEVRHDVPGFCASILQPTLHIEDVPLHTHESASLVFVLEGTYRTSADSPAKISSTPMVIYNPPGTTHRDSFVVPQGRFMALSLSADVTQIVQQGSGLPKVPTAFLSGDSLRAAERLVHLCTKGGAGDSLVIEDRCWELLAAASGTTQADRESEKVSPPWLRRARELLNDCAGTGLSITAVAQKLDLHPIYFARSFRKHFRCSPAEYRRRCRLQSAMKLLLRGKQTLSTVALSAGFFDQSHLTTAFKQHFGQAPGRFRRGFETSDPGSAEVPFLQERPEYR